MRKLEVCDRAHERPASPDASSQEVPAHATPDPHPAADDDVVTAAGTEWAHEPIARTPVPSTVAARTVPPADVDPNAPTRTAQPRSDHGETTHVSGDGSCPYGCVEATFLAPQERKEEPPSCETQ